MITLQGEIPAADTARRATLRLTAATNGSATLSGDRLVIEVQNILWSLPCIGGRALQVTTADLEPTRPIFSPDGELLAVCAYKSGEFHIWTLRPDGSNLCQRTNGPWDDRSPAWSPDGTHIAFASERGGDPVTGCPYRIWLLEVVTGRLTQLSGLPGQKGPLQEGPWEDFDPTWSPDGQRVLFIRGCPTPGPFGTVVDARTIASVRVDGTGPVQVVRTDSTTGAQLMTPAVSLEGRLAYLRTTLFPAASCTLVVDGEPVPVKGDVGPVPPRWVSRDELLLTVSGQFHRLPPDRPQEAKLIPFTAALTVDRPCYQVKKYDFDGRGVRPVRGIHLPALSPDGRQVAFAALNSLWVGPTSGGIPPRVIARARPTQYVLAPSWARDGRSLIYADDGDGAFAVRRHDLATGKETVLACGGRVQPALSPDGNRLACLDMSGNLVIRDLSKGTERILANPLSDGGLPGRPSWSPSGRYITFCDRKRINQRFREGYNLIRVVDTSNETTMLHAVAPHVSISDCYDSGPVWSPDGRWMAVIIESALWLLPVRHDGTPDGPPRQLTQEPADHPSWSGDSRTLLYVSADKLRLIEAAGGATRTVHVPLTYRRPNPANTVVHVGQLWDGTGETLLHDVDVVVTAGRISSVEPHRARRPTRHRVDASSYTVLPGLWDAHTHPWQITYGARQTLLQLAYGITTAVSFGGLAYEQARIREAVATRELTGPRLLTTGELLDGTRVAYSIGRAHRTSEGLSRSLARAKALNWDFVKTYVRAPAWLMAQAAQFAHEQLGVRSGSHLCVPGIQVGQDLTAHFYVTQRREFGHDVTAAGHSYEDVLELHTATDFRMVATPFSALALIGADPKLADDPRVTVMMPPWDLAMVRQLAARPPTRDQLISLEREIGIYRRVLLSGGLVALGTDSPVVPIGLQLHLSLRALNRCGLSPSHALRMATAIPAQVFGADGELGTIEMGKLADMTVVDGDPFTDFDSLVRTVSVLHGGVPVKQCDLIGSFSTSR